MLSYLNNLESSRPILELPNIPHLATGGCGAPGLISSTNPRKKVIPMATKHNLFARFEKSKADKGDKGKEGSPKEKATDRKQMPMKGKMSAKKC